MNARRIVCGVFWLTGAAGAWGEIATDQAVTLIFPSGHWSSIQTVNFYGTEATPFATPVREMGWWYRIEGDTREHPLPPPSRVDSSRSGEFTASWDNVHGTGMRLTEIVRVFDNEGPSGAISSGLYGSMSPTAPAKTVHFFHFVHLAAGGTFDNNDVGVLQAPGYLKFTDRLTGDVVRYRAFRGPYPVHYQVRAFPLLRMSLFDSSPTNLDDTGLPFAAGQAEAAFQTTVLLQPNVGTQMAQIQFSSRLASDYVRGALLASTYPSLLAARGDTVIPGHYGYAFRRTSYLASTGYGPLDDPFVPVALDDFDGDYETDVVTRHAVDGSISIDFTRLETQPPAGWELATTGDFDGDGKADILWLDTATRRLELWFMDGLRRLRTRTPAPAEAPANWRVVGSGDFDGAGGRDLLWHDQDGQRLVIWILDGLQRRRASDVVQPPYATGQGWRVVSVGDFGKGPNGLLGTPDIVWQNDSSRRVVVWHMDRLGVRTAGTFTTPDVLGPGPTGDVVDGPR